MVMVPWELKYSQANHFGLHYTVPLQTGASNVISLSLMKANLVFPDHHVLLYLPDSRQTLPSKVSHHSDKVDTGKTDIKRSYCSPSRRVLRFGRSFKP